MKRYIGTKIVTATQMNRADYNVYRGWTLPADEDGADDGYLVEYMDGGKPNDARHAGYISWSPKEQFDNAYRQTAGMAFGAAVEALKLGKKVSRAGWNGKGMWLAMIAGDSWGIGGHAPYDTPGAPHITHAPFIGMKTADNKFVPWLASQTDVLADDWGVVDEDAKAEIPEGFTPWSAGECPVPPDTEVEVIFDQDGRKGFCAATHLRWTNAPGFSIIAYRVVETPKPKAEIPEGFMSWSGKAFPVSPATEVEVVYNDGSRELSVARDLSWCNAGDSYRIIAYRVVEPRTPKNETTEQAIQAAGANVAPRVTPADLEANIAKEAYFTALDGINGRALSEGDHSVVVTTEYALLTFCVLVLRNGFTVTGESACASPENFDAELGRKIAREKAINKVWPLLGYELRTKLAK